MGAEGRDGPLGEVGGPDGDSVAGLHAVSEERPRRGVYLVAVVGEGPAPFFVNEGLLAAESAGSVVDQLRDGRPGSIHRVDPMVRSHTTGQPGWSTTGSPDRTSPWGGW